MRVQVTNDDISYGVPFSGIDNPVCFAINRAMGDKYHTVVIGRTNQNEPVIMCSKQVFEIPPGNVGNESRYLWNLKSELTIRLAKEVYKFIQTFNETGDGEPFEFEIEI